MSEEILMIKQIFSIIQGMALGYFAFRMLYIANQRVYSVLNRNKTSMALSAEDLGKEE